VNGSGRVVDIATGDLNGGGRDDLITAFNNRIVWSWEPWVGFLGGAIMNGTIDEVQSVNINMAGTDEIAVNIREVGIIVYDDAFTELWRFTAPTVSPKSIAFEDFNNDGIHST
jgi:hypothetical protein